MASFKDRIKSLVKRKLRNKQQSPAIASRNQSNNQTPLTREPAAGEQSAPPQQQQQQQHPIVTHNKSVEANQKAATTTGSLQVALVNQSNSNQVYAYISSSHSCSICANIKLTSSQLAKRSTTTMRSFSSHRTQELHTIHQVPLQQAQLSAPTLPFLSELPEILSQRPSLGLPVAEYGSPLARP